MTCYVIMDIFILQNTKLSAEVLLFYVLLPTDSSAPLSTTKLRTSCCGSAASCWDSAGICFISMNCGVTSQNSLKYLCVSFVTRCDVTAQWTRIWTEKHDSHWTDGWKATLTLSKKGRRSGTGKRSKTGKQGWKRSRKSFIYSQRTSQQEIRNRQAAAQVCGEQVKGGVSRWVSDWCANKQSKESELISQLVMWCSADVCLCLRK